MYRNIVFDLGGVVINYNPKDYLADRYFHERVERKLYEAVFASAEWQLLDKGDITWDDAKQTFLKRAREKDVLFEMETLLDEWSDMLTTRKATVVLMRLLKKKGFDLYYLSNIAEEPFKMLEERSFWPLFSGGVASFEVNTLKPDIEIYQALLDKYDLIPEETIFTDDNKQNAAAAFTVGITGIPFVTVKGLVKGLVNYGIDMD